MSVKSLGDGNKSNPPSQELSKKVVGNRHLSSLIISFLPGKESSTAAAATCRAWSQLALTHFGTYELLYLTGNDEFLTSVVRRPVRKVKGAITCPTHKELGELLAERSNIRVIDLSRLKPNFFKSAACMSQIMNAVVSSCRKAEVLALPNLHQSNPGVRVLHFPAKALLYKPEECTQLFSSLFSCLPPRLHTLRLCDENPATADLCCFNPLTALRKEHTLDSLRSISATTLNLPRDFNLFAHFPQLTTVKLVGQACLPQMMMCGAQLSTLHISGLSSDDPETVLAGGPKDPTEPRGVFYLTDNSLEIPEWSDERLGGVKSNTQLQSLHLTNCIVDGRLQLFIAQKLPKCKLTTTQCFNPDD
jgi:hypothetical protein